MNIREVAEAALRDILRHPKGTVYASRRGIVAGSTQPLRCMNVLFRREGGRVHLELSERMGQEANRLQEFPLPDDLEQRAAKMLDEL